jgi:hypothetical protein
MREKVKKIEEIEEIEVGVSRDFNSQWLNVNV